MRIMSRPADLTHDPRGYALDRTDRLLLVGLAIALAMLIGADGVSARGESEGQDALRASAQQSSSTLSAKHGATAMGISVPLPPPS